MPMFAWWSEVRARIRRATRDRRGGVAIEFALLAPVLITVVFGLAEIGRALQQASSVEKGLRAGALYAARVDFPLSQSDRDRALNLARTGTLDGSGGLVATGYTRDNARLNLEIGSYWLDDQMIPVIRLEAEVPFVPMSDWIADLLNLNQRTMRLSHEQAYLGT